MTTRRRLARLQAVADGCDPSALAGDKDGGYQWSLRAEQHLVHAVGADDELVKRFHQAVYVAAYTGDRLKAFRSAKAILGAAVLRLELEAEDAPDPGPVSITPAPGSAPVDRPEPETGPLRSIFVVHGHDGSAKFEVANWLAAVTGRQPTILHQMASSGQTIVEKFEEYAGMAGYAVVLLTPDDVGRAKSVTDLNQRARQNVVFELGYFYGRLGRRNVAVLNAGVEPPSDVNGLVYIDFPASNWKSDLAKELRAAGFTLDGDQI